MPTFTANQTRPASSQAARVSVSARFTATRLVPALTHVLRLELERFELNLSAMQQVPQVALAWWRGPAEPRPPGAPAAPRPRAGSSG